MQFTQPALLALTTILSLLPTATSATPAPAPATIPPQNPIVVNLIAYEFPYCLSSTSSLLQNLFLSLPTDTKLVTSHSSNKPQDSSSECKDVNASKGVPHSFFFTADGDLEGCELRTWEEVGCKGEGEGRRLDGKGFSECFTRPERFVKPLLRSARVVCG